MSYAKHNFKKGEVLHASQLNDMDDLLEKSEDALDTENAGKTEYRVMLTPTEKVNGKMRSASGWPWGNSPIYGYALYDVEQGQEYYVYASTPRDAVAYPAVAFFNASGEHLLSVGTDESTTYEDLKVTAPEDAVKMCVNKASYTLPIKAEMIFTTTGSARLDDIKVGVMDAERKLKEVREVLGIGDDVQVKEGEVLTPTKTVDGIRHTNGSIASATNVNAKHNYYDVNENSYYFINGNTPGAGSSYPACVFLDEAGALLSVNGTENNTRYRNLLVYAPENAVTMIINKSWSGFSISAIEGIAQNDTDVVGKAAQAYDLNIACQLIRHEKQNPFVFDTFDKGYVTFIFDDLRDDIDSIASIFELYNFPVCLASIPDKMGTTCTFLQQTRGNFTPGMTKKEVMQQVVANGGEILTHNTSVITAETQFDYNFMYDHFVTSKQALQDAGFEVRGFITAGGANAITRTPEIHKWLVGNYDYSDAGLTANHDLRRYTIQITQAEMKAKLLDAYNNHKWLRFSAHDYAHGESGTFMGEEDLIDTLEYCQSIGIEVATMATVFDRYANTVFGQYMQGVTS